MPASDQSNSRGALEENGWRLWRAFHCGLDPLTLDPAVKVRERSPLRGQLGGGIRRVSLCSGERPVYPAGPAVVGYQGVAPLVPPIRASFGGAGRD